MNTNPQRLGRYELRELVGRGGIAEVWKAVDGQSQQVVTIKLFRPNLANDPDFLVRFQHEAQSASSLHHPNIVQVRDFQVAQPPESESAMAYFVLDYVEGVQFTNYIRAIAATKKFPSKETLVQLFASIGSAIDYVHRQGVIHHNINPTNILLDIHRTSFNTVGEPLLTDFGIATILGLSSSPKRGMFQGDPAYLAPEQIHGYPGNELSDLYSLGVILYELCTGGLPFQRNSPSSMLSLHVGVTPTPPALLNPNIPPPLTMVLLRSLAREPSERFPTASAMVGALAEALNVPPPEGLSSVRASEDAMYMPTYITSPDAKLPAAMTPVPPPWSSSISSSPARSSAVALSTPATPSTALPAAMPLPSSGTSSAGIELHAPAGPTNGIPVVALPTAAPTPPATLKRKRRGPLVALLALVLLIIGATVAGVFYLWPPNSPPPPRPKVVGNAFFFSSGQLNRTTSQGINDGLQITFQQITPPAPGQAYYAWLLTDSSQSDAAGPSILLGTLTVIHGQAHLSYTDPDHNNLLSIASRLLVTQEDASVTPVNPSLDTSAWRYVAALPNTPPANSKFSLLDHLRHLLVKEPNLEARGLHGGLTTWFARDTEDVMVWSESARDDQKPQSLGLMRDQLIRILEILDSTAYAKKLGDLPPDTPLKADPAQSQIAMFTFDATNQTPAGYLDHIGRHLKSLVNTPGVTSDQIHRAEAISKDLNIITSWLQKVRQDAIQLEQFAQQGDAQLLSAQALSLLDDMAAQALYAYVGQLDPRTNKEVAGVVQVTDNMERLATFNISLYKGK